MSLEQRLAASAKTLDAAIDTHVARGTSKRRRRHWQRGFSIAASVVIAVAGLAGVFAVRSAVDAPGSNGVASVPPIAPETSPPLDPTTGSSLLTTAVPADVQPLVSMPEPGWTVEAVTGFVPVTVEPSSACPGCGATRLVLAADGPLLSGPVFTAWSVSGGVDLDRFAAPVTVGGVDGRATSSPPGTPAALNRMTVAWPLGDGPGALTAIVDARGLSNDQVVQMAATLTWESRVPVMPARPAGFHQIDPPAPGATVETYLNLSNGHSSLEVYATNAGMHGLVDWHSLGNVLMWDWEQRVIDGVPVAFDVPAADEQPIVAATAAWVAGGWGYVVIGHVFDSEADFLDAVAALRLTDAASFATATANAPATAMPTFTSTNGWDGIVPPGS